ncbi:hypothetical protein E4U19_000168 [Claviceps sp. Clav32 group G5]|nr:hypothetical protein E4U19_000168 [Claviceps sp. Clav32 group G5]
MGRGLVLLDDSVWTILETDFGERYKLIIRNDDILAVTPPIDLEPAWALLKRETTKKGAPKNRQEAVAAWKAAWDELSQEKIRAWIERIPRHIQEVIRLGGGNEYKEGRA